ncbi:MAG: NAD-dependent epimerase/dehydratase family protein [Armatimonadetes bacterium]|nr:NAD-dependent epimerase/dehydratase family protein [Armatimonadota bacterium]
MERTSHHVVVAGGLGYTGSFITKRLLDEGLRVTALTAHPSRPLPLRDRVTVAPFAFDDPEALRESLRGASVLYTTYWVRFDRGDVSFAGAIENTKTLLRCAREAGIERVVHLSVTNPSADSKLPYYRGKALVEQAVIESGLSYAIIRPTLIFALGDILLNNIAWMLRRFPVFALFGDGKYLVQPVSAEDVAEIAVRAASDGRAAVLDAAGPETFTFSDLVGLIRSAVGSRAAVLGVPPTVALIPAALIGCLLGDVVVTRDEVTGLMTNLLVSGEPPRGRARFTEWVAANGQHLGRQYASELTRHFRQQSG